MTTTDHAAIAFDLIDGYETDPRLPLEGKIALAQVHATLALVEATRAPEPTPDALQYAIDGAIPDDLPGWREHYTERAAGRVLSLIRHGDADRNPA